MIIAKPIHSNERDLLIGNEHLPLTITDLNRVLINETYAPENGWTHELIDKELEAVPGMEIMFGYDVYLGSEWIGSSEI